MAICGRSTFCFFHYIACAPIPDRKVPKVSAERKPSVVAGMYYNAAMRAEEHQTAAPSRLRRPAPSQRVPRLCTRPAAAPAASEAILAMALAMRYGHTRPFVFSLPPSWDEVASFCRWAAHRRSSRLRTCTLTTYITRLPGTRHVAGPTAAQRRRRAVASVGAAA